MRRNFVWVLCPSVLSLTAGVAACSGNGNSASDASVDSYGVIVPGGDGGASDEGGDADAAPEDETTMRLAHASPDLGPIDFCWRPAGAASFTGPVLGGGTLPEAGPPSSDAGGDAGDAGGAGDAADGGEGGDGQAAADAGDASPKDSGHEEEGGHVEDGGQDAGETAPIDAGTHDATLSEGGSDDAGPGDAEPEAEPEEATLPEAGPPHALLFGS